MNGKNLSRRQILQASAGLGCLAGVPLGLAAGWKSLDKGDKAGSPSVANPLKPPADGKIPVAFLISDGAVVIDFAGPWEVFQNVMLADGMSMPFQTYTVSESTKPITASGGMKIVPDYSLDNAPTPKVVVIPAQKDPSEAVLNWVRKSAKTADVTMSVCTGAFLLAKTGLLNGKAATTHHGAYVTLAQKYPQIQVKRGMRFVEDGNLASSGGLSSGIDLALRVVERYYGTEQAKQTAFDLEYQGQGWMDPNSNAVYTHLRTSEGNRTFCVVCGMTVDPAVAPKTAYQGKTYYFCSADHKAQFEAAPAEFTK
jgi:putative intracellular protease/amidase/YHS domain-containing protein